MGHDQLIMRLLSTYSGLPLNKIVSGSDLQHLSNNYSYNSKNYGWDTETLLNDGMLSNQNTARITWGAFPNANPTLVLVDQSTAENLYNSTTVSLTFVSDEIITD